MHKLISFTCYTGYAAAFTAAELLREHLRKRIIWNGRKEVTVALMRVEN
jgi:hypothetical protein